MMELKGETDKRKGARPGPEKDDEEERIEGGVEEKEGE